jgi:hypothetical protein
MFSAIPASRVSRRPGSRRDELRALIDELDVEEGLAAPSRLRQRDLLTCTRRLKRYWFAFKPLKAKQNDGPCSSDRRLIERLEFLDWRLQAQCPAILK